MSKLNPEEKAACREIWATAKKCGLSNREIVSVIKYTARLKWTTKDCANPS